MTLFNELRKLGGHVPKAERPRAEAAAIVREAVALGEAHGAAELIRGDLTLAEAKAELTRRAAIRAQCTGAGYPFAAADQIARGLTLAESRSRLADLAKTAPGIRTGKDEKAAMLAGWDHAIAGLGGGSARPLPAGDPTWNAAVAKINAAAPPGAVVARIAEEFH